MVVRGNRTKADLAEWIFLKVAMNKQINKLENQSILKPSRKQQKSQKNKSIGYFTELPVSRQKKSIDFSRQICRQYVEQMHIY